MTWCGRLVDGEGVRHDPAQLASQRCIPLPPTAVPFRGFCGLRKYIVNNARAVAPLVAKLESVTSPLGRKKKQLCGVDLSWEEDKKRLLYAVKVVIHVKRNYSHTPTMRVLVFRAYAFRWSEAVVIYRSQTLAQNDAPPSAVEQDRLLRVEDRSGCPLMLATSSNGL
ncbi:hypothetical protein PsorP6_017286 [Peronosclerospora sorghi]|uniref:Uncharacterized protein n=1 Tax=Peronosclerospora sorghi TaxID=230839 RepID=A0ACC0WPC5_9STRA|nr:hypothetical protein PsorP6_017286 [Peronosclerospora sorghi]